MKQEIIIPPFVESPDSFRCGQSVVLMILKHFIPEREWSFEDADKICGYVEEKWTWSEAAAVSLAEIGFEVQCITDFDIEAFLKSPENYFVKKYGPENGIEMLTLADMKSTVEYFNRYLSNPNILTIKRSWTVQDAIALLNEGYLLMTWVDSDVLSSLNLNGSGHFVTVFHYDENLQRIIFHNPGYLSSKLGIYINAAKSTCIGIDHFMKAAKADGESGSSLTAFRLKK